MKRRRNIKGIMKQYILYIYFILHDLFQIDGTHQTECIPGKETQWPALTVAVGNYIH